MNQTITAGQAFNPFTHFRLRLIGDPIIPQDILNSGVKLPVARTYAVLAQKAGFDGACFPKIETVAQLVGLSYRQVARHIKILIAKGLLALRHRRRANGWFRNSEYFFLWHASFSAPKNVRPSRAKMSEQKVTEFKAEEADKTTNANELLPQPADRGPEAAQPSGLPVLRDAIQDLHNGLPGGSSRSSGTASLRTASWFRHRASQAVGRKLTAAETAEMVTGSGFRGHLDSLRRRRKTPLTISGIAEYLYNWLAPQERQTLNYRPENGLPMAEYQPSAIPLHALDD